MKVELPVTRQTETCLRQVIQIPFSYPLLFTRNAFAPGNDALGSVFAADGDGVERRVLVCVDEGVWEAWPTLEDQIVRYFAKQPAELSLYAEIVRIPGGDEAKQGLRWVETVLQKAGEAGIDRQSYILVIGGGAVVDAVGLAAALLHRGVRLIRMPTTVLGQNDAGVGVKNGTNYMGQKNFLGTFAPPYAVVNDYSFLETLADEDWIAGISEALKVALIKDASFFRYLEKHAAALSGRDGAAMEAVVHDCARIHVEHISDGGDPFERGSARPLDFGHWSAHWLEMASGGEVGHGRAVAIGIGLDTLYAEEIGLVTAEERERILHTLRTLGFELWSEQMALESVNGEPAVLEGLEQFREHLGGRLTITLPKGIGRRVEVHEIERPAMKRALRRLQADGGDVQDVS